MTKYKYQYKKLRRAIIESPRKIGSGRLRESQELMQGYKILRKSTLDEIMDVRIYATYRMRKDGYQWCAAVWIHNDDIYKSWFSPLTNGSGFEKLSACVYDALPLAVQEYVPSFHGVGEGAMEDGLLNIAKAIVGPDIKVHMVKFHA